MKQPDPLILGDLMRVQPRGMPVTLVLLGLNVAVFVLMLASGAGFWHGVNEVSLAWGAGFGPATQDRQWWRLFTALFVHFGVLHLGLNLWALWDVGRLVERVHGPARFLALYVGSGLVGNLASLAAHGNQAISGGASGAIFGLYGALVVFLWRERARIARSEFRWIMGASALFPLLMLGLGLGVPEIDNAAHGAGLLAGALLGVVLAPCPASGRRGPARPAWWSGVALGAAVLALLWGLPQPRYRFGEEAQARQAIQRFLVEEREINQRWSALMAGSPTALVRAAGPGRGRADHPGLSAEFRAAVLGPARVRGALAMGPERAAAVCGATACGGEPAGGRSAGA
ncbi:MAG: rhomboid family intramembrane serine protease [Hylemonella sp.]|uniref:rhomboid family intramembrane serine protease n=1 Tax=Hylemonella sp. TaxID=2066020 RepID=UPI00391B34FC